MECQGRPDETSESPAGTNEFQRIMIPKGPKNQELPSGQTDSADLSCEKPTDLPPPERLEDEIGYFFRNRALLLQALTHRSYVDEQAGRGLSHNETMEFLGDAILGFFISRELRRRFPEAKVGALAKAKSYLVSTAHLYQLAGSLQLGSCLLLSTSEEKTLGRQKRALLADAYEALIAAIYLDGGIEVAEAFLSRQFEPLLAGLNIETAGQTDYKSTLLETICLWKWPEPRFRVLKETGPPHDKTFLVALEIPDIVSFQAEGRSKKEAQQAASHLALQTLESPRR